MPATHHADRPKLTVLAGWMFRRLSAPSRLRLGIAAVLMVAAALMDASVPVIIGWLINSVVGEGTVQFDAMTISAIVVIAAVMFGTQVLMVARRQLVENVATAFERETRIIGLKHLMHLPGVYFTKSLTGAIHERTARGIEGSTRLLKLLFMDLLPASVLAAASILVAFLAGNLLIGLLMIGVIPTGLFLVHLQIRSQDGVRREIRDVKESIAGAVTELLPALDTVRANAAEPFFEANVRQGAVAVREAEMKHHRAMGWFDIAKYGNETLWFIAVLTVALVQVQQGTTGPGAVLTIALLFLKVLTPLRELHRILDESAECAKQTADLVELLAEPIDRIYVEPAGIMITPTKVIGSALQVHDVTFDYVNPITGQDTQVLKGVTFDVQAGTRTVVAGSSGCGKSTLMQVIARLQHDYHGSIRLFGDNLTDLPQALLSTRIGYVAQQPFMFRGTIRENIIFGWDHPTTDADLIEAATKAHIADVIDNLPDGYDTLVHEGGRSLSGGQRQRLSLARALLRKPQLLLLDEPTAALDNESHRTVQSAIDSLQGVTIIEVAHRLSSARTADKVLVMEDGVVVQEGTFQELAATDGRFKNLMEFEQSLHVVEEGDRSIEPDAA